MKDKRNKHIKFIVEKIVKAEKEIALGQNVQENEDKISKIMSSLSMEDLFEVNSYIERKNLLTS